MTQIITLPGIGGSAEGHWQSLWEEADKSFTRFRPSSWDQPVLTDWLEALESEIRECDRPPVLVAHSLACLLVAHWAAGSTSTIAGAFLVSTPDPDELLFPIEAASFRQVPTQSMRFPSLMISSTDDPFGTIDYARKRAEQWQSGLVLVGALGHINAASGIGDWPQGRALLDAFCVGLSRSA